MSLNAPESEDHVTNVYVRLLRLPPQYRLITGIGCVLGGAFLTWSFWERGVVWGLTLFVVAGGLFMSVSGALDWRKQVRRRKYLESIRDRKDELLDGLIAAKRSGKNPVRWLNEQGITDAELRKWFFGAMEERLKGDPGKE